MFDYAAIGADSFQRSLEASAISPDFQTVPHFTEASQP